MSDDAGHVVLGRTLTDYEHQQMLAYGRCEVCGGPRTGRITVEGQPPDTTLLCSMQCLWCGIPWTGFATDV